MKKNIKNKVILSNKTKKVATKGYDRKNVISFTIKDGSLEYHRQNLLEHREMLVGMEEELVNNLANIDVISYEDIKFYEKNLNTNIETIESARQHCIEIVQDRKEMLTFHENNKVKCVQVIKQILAVQKEMEMEGHSDPEAEGLFNLKLKEFKLGIIEVQGQIDIAAADLAALREYIKVYTQVFNRIEIPKKDLLLAIKKREDLKKD